MTENTANQIVDKGELEEMFDQGFLSKVQVFCERVLKIRAEENLEEVHHFVLSLQMEIYPADFPLNFEKEGKHTYLSLNPITISLAEEAEKIRQKALEKKDEDDSLPT